MERRLLEPAARVLTLQRLLRLRRTVLRVMALTVWVRLLPLFVLWLSLLSMHHRPDLLILQGVPIATL